MDRLRKLIEEAERDLEAARAMRQPGERDRFKEIEAFAAMTRLNALKDAMRAIGGRP